MFKPFLLLVFAVGCWSRLMDLNDEKFNLTPLSGSKDDGDTSDTLEGEGEDLTVDTGPQPGEDEPQEAKNSTKRQFYLPPMQPIGQPFQIPQAQPYQPQAQQYQPQGQPFQPQTSLFQPQAQPFQPQTQPQAQAYQPQAQQFQPFQPQVQPQAQPYSPPVQPFQQPQALPYQPQAFPYPQAPILPFYYPFRQILEVHHIVMLQQPSCPPTTPRTPGTFPTPPPFPTTTPGGLDDRAGEMGNNNGTRRPSRCVWAIVACCSPDSTTIRYSCFELLGCPGAFWGVNPCELRVVQAAANTALNFYMTAGPEETGLTENRV